MTRRFASFPNLIFIATCLAVGCSIVGTLGCGSSDGGGGAPTVDTQLLGIYAVDRYTGNLEGCDETMDFDVTPSRVALYSLPSNDDPTEAILVGQFCGSVGDCRDQVRDLPALTNYSFFEGSDTAGWQGWGIAREGSRNDMCLVEVQSHFLTSSSGGAITIDTTQVETEFRPLPAPPGTNELECSVKDAIAAIEDDSPCKALFLLEATFETNL